MSLECEILAKCRCHLVLVNTVRRNEVSFRSGSQIMSERKRSDGIRKHFLHPQTTWDCPCNLSAERHCREVRNAGIGITGDSVNPVFSTLVCSIWLQFGHLLWHTLLSSISLSITSAVTIPQIPPILPSQNPPIFCVTTELSAKFPLLLLVLGLLYYLSFIRWNRR